MDYLCKITFNDGFLMKLPSKKLKEHWAFLIGYSVFLVACILPQLFYDKIEIALFINRLNTPFLDVFFKYYTLFGTFTLIAPIIVYQLFLKYRYALVTTASTLISLILSQFCKRLVWPDSPRPKVFFKELTDIHYVDGVHLHSAHSFPSGHTTGAFALFVALALLNKRPGYQMLFLVAAILVGYSRMYLSQHFLVDVTVGSLIGVFSAWVSYRWFFSPKYLRMTALDGSLALLFRRSR
jgi:membrane-associated phospholipid phosphatase